MNKEDIEKIIEYIKARKCKHCKLKERYPLFCRECFYGITYSTLTYLTEELTNDADDR